MDTKTQLTLPEWLTSNPRTSKLIVIVVVMVIALVVVRFSGLQTTEQKCSLWTNCKLHPEELQRIEIAFGQAGLSEFEINDGEFIVPKSKLADYLRVVADNNLLPESLDNSHGSAGINPFLTRAQQQQLRNNNKKREICEMVGRLPFVQRAWLEMDTAKTGSAFNETIRSAVISIQPGNNQNLSTTQIHTIRKIVGASLASINDKDIVVTDLNAGIAYENHSGSMQENLADFWAANQSAEKLQLEYEQRIASALVGYEGIEFNVKVQLTPVNKNRMAELPSELVKQTSDQAKPPERFASATPMKAGTNGAMSIDDLNPEIEQPAADVKPPNMMQPLQVASAPVFSENVSVDIRVPKPLVEKSMSSHSNSGKQGQPNIETEFLKLKSQIVSRLKPILPVSAFANSTQFPISVEMMSVQSAELSDNELGALVEWSKAQLPSIIVLLAGGILLFIVMQQRQEPSFAEDSETATPLSTPRQMAAESDEGLDPQQQLSKQHLSDLIDQDPEAAAQVIKTWIRNAA